ncbi:MAG: hypothetical protein HY735_03160 [Verrucomicrobia bacterium]|nr:hypothetical protein [Verrucomicrobiota bacterium]
MKTDSSGTRDESLRALLNEWSVASPLPANFAGQVWRRIDRADRGPTFFAAALFHWIATALPRPALAGAYFAVLLAIGASVGWAQSHQKTARVSEELSLRYVRSIDPYQSPR